MPQLASREQQLGPAGPRGPDPQALIREARRRARRRRAGLLSSGAALAALACAAYLAGAPAGRGIVAETASRPFANPRAFGPADGIVAFVSRSRLWVLDGRTGSLRVLTPPSQQPADPQFSPNGRWLTYTLENGDQVWVARAGGSGARRIPDSSGGAGSWLPTGELLDEGVIWRIGRGGAITRAGRAPDLVAWSPRGGRYVFLSTRWSGPLSRRVHGVQRLSVASSIGGRRTTWVQAPLSFSPSSGMTGNVIARVSVLPRAEGIVFDVDPGMGNSAFADGTNIYAVSSAGVRPRPIGAALGLPVATSGAGEVAIADGRNRYQWMTKSVHTCSPASVRCTPVTAARGMLSFDPAWSADGRMLAFVEAPSSAQTAFPQAVVQRWYATHSLWLIRRPGGLPTRIAGATGASAPVWSSNGRSIMFVAGDSLWLLPTLASRPVRIAGPLFEPGVWPTYYGEVDWPGQFAWLTSRSG
jgi:hypothetical protein